MGWGGFNQHQAHRQFVKAPASHYGQKLLQPNLPAQAYL